MHLRNKTSKGNGLIAAIIAIAIILGALGVYFWVKMGGAMGPASSRSAVELAKHFPTESENFLAADLSGGIWDKVPMLLEKSNDDKYPEFQQQLTDAETELGIPVKEFVSYLDGRFATTVVRDGGLPSGMALVGLKDADAYKAWMTKKHGESTDTVNGVPFWKLSYGAVMGVNNEWVFWCRSGDNADAGLKAVEKLITSQGSGGGLADNSLFKKAISQVDLSNSELVIFHKLEAIGPQVTELKELGFDKRTETLLAELQFAVAGVDLTGRSSEGLIGIVGEGTNLAKAMTGPGRMKTETLTHFSNNATWMVGLDLQWTMDLVVALGELHPKSRNQVSMLPMGLAMMGNPMQGINGEAWIATDLLDVSYEAAKQSVLNGGSMMDAPDPSLVLLAPTKDNKALDGFIAKSLGVESSDFEEGEVRDYPSPDPSAKLTVDTAHNLLKISVGTQTPSLEATDENLAQNATLSELQEWGGANTVYLDFVDFTPMAKKLENEEEPQLVAVRDALKYWGRDTIDGGLCVATSPEGLRYRAVGTGGGLGIYFGAVVSLAAPNFVGARSKGQLTACKSNEKNMGTALEMYSTDWSGKYPENTSLLTPNYLKTIPNCPSAGRDTYSESYKRGKVGPAPGVDGYSFYCSGHNHAEAGLSPNKPAYNAAEGIVE